MQKLIFVFMIVLFMGAVGVVLAREYIVPQPDNSQRVAETSEVILAELSASGEVNIVSIESRISQDWDLIELSAQGYVNVVIDEPSNLPTSCLFELQEKAAEGFVTITSCR